MNESNNPSQSQDENTRVQVTFPSDLGKVEFANDIAVQVDAEDVVLLLGDDEATRLAVNKSRSLLMAAGNDWHPTAQQAAQIDEALAAGVAKPVRETKSLPTRNSE